MLIRGWLSALYESCDIWMSTLIKIILFMQIYFFNFRSWTRHSKEGDVLLEVVLVANMETGRRGWGSFGALDAPQRLLVHSLHD